MKVFFWNYAPFFLFAIQAEVEIMVCWFHWNLKFALENSKIQNNQTQIFPEIFSFAGFKSENRWIDIETILFFLKSSFKNKARVEGSR